MHSCDKKKTTASDARENDSAANRNRNATALRIIIDSPSYIIVIQYFRETRKIFLPLINVHFAY